MITILLKEAKKSFRDPIIYGLPLNNLILIYVINLPHGFGLILNFIDMIHVILVFNK